MQCRENRFPWNGRRHLGDSGNGGTTLEFLSPFLCRAPPLEMRRECREFFPDHAGKGSLLSSYERETGLFWMWAGLSSFLSSGGALHPKGERNSRVVLPFPESPRCLSPFQGNLFSLHCLDFQAEDQLTPRWHVGLPCGKASGESLVGKPLIH